MKKVLTFFLILLCIAAIFGGYIAYSRIDRTAPVILVLNGEEKQYHSGMTTQELLNGVTAIDDQSGDVSGTLYVESVNATADPGQVEVVYTARDKSKNTGRYTYLMRSDGSAVDYVPEAAPPADQSDSGVAGAAESVGSSGSQGEAENSQPGEEAQSSDASSETDGADASAEAQASVSPEEAALRQEAEDAISQLLPESPRIRLLKYYEEILHGTEMDLMYYVKELQDDKDSVDDLIAKMQVFSDVNIDVPGTYHVSYYTMDSDGHQSNVAILTVRVL